MMSSLYEEVKLVTSMFVRSKPRHDIHYASAKLS